MMESFAPLGMTFHSCRLDRFGKSPTPVILDQPATALIRQGDLRVSSKSLGHVVQIAQTLKSFTPAIQFINKIAEAGEGA